jgi:two-component system nitrate/nitrite response regulator NarL
MHLLIADDHHLLRDTLEALLRDMFDDINVLHAASLSEAVEAARKANALDLVLLDLKMPGMNGLMGIAALRSQCPNVPVVIISGDEHPDTVRAALQAGAAGFIPKTMHGRPMLNALQLVLSGARYVPDLTLESNSRSSTSLPASDGAEGLTRREREVMSLLTKGLANKEIARRLEIEPVTVSLHLRSIYRKLQVSNRTQAVRLAMQLGWDR